MEIASAFGCEGINYFDKSFWFIYWNIKPSFQCIWRNRRFFTVQFYTVLQPYWLHWKQKEFQCSQFWQNGRRFELSRVKCLASSSHLKVCVIYIQSIFSLNKNLIGREETSPGEIKKVILLLSSCSCSLHPLSVFTVSRTAYTWSYPQTITSIWYSDTIDSNILSPKIILLCSTYENSNLRCAKVEYWMFPGGVCIKGLFLSMGLWELVKPLRDEV